MQIRTKKRLKIIGVSLGVSVVMLLTAVAIFVFNPFEGSLADVRYAVPRDVDFFLRKVDLKYDFEEFPEPWFWEDLRSREAWAELKSGPTYRGLDGQGEISRMLDQVRDQVEQASLQSSGLLDLMRDVLGGEIQIAGRWPGGAVTEWCVYARVTWRTKFVWGLLGYGFVQEKMRQGGLQVQPDEELYAIQRAGDPAPIYAARHLDCLMLGNSRELVHRSWELAAGIGDATSFGGSSSYQDGVRRRIFEWEETTDQIANALEFYAKPDKLFALPGVTFDDNWPDPRHPDDMNSRVLASFLNLQGWLGLTGALVFEDSSVSLLANVELDQTEHTAFQQKFFRTESQHRKDWLDPFLQMVPADACAVAAMRMPAGEFLHEMYAATDDASKSLLNDALSHTGKYDSVPELIDRLEPAFLRRTGFVFRKNKPDPDPRIVVAAPSPMPQVAWVFWLRKDGVPLITEFVELLTSYREVIGFENAWNLPLDLGGAGQSVAGDAAREFTHPQIPATGEIATLVYGEFFVLSNSGPFIRDMMHAAFGNQPSIRTREDFREYSDELPSTINGFIYLQAREIERVLGDYERDIVTHTQNPDPEWAMRELPAAENEVFRRSYAKYGSKAGLPPDVRPQFDVDVNKEIEARWRESRTAYTAQAQGSVLEAMALMRLFESAYVQLTLEPRYLKLTGRAISKFR